MALPNFVCVGAEKGGTTPLMLVLMQHRDVFVSPQKETRYFTRGYAPGNLVFYETMFFKGYRSQKAIGELTPDYMRFAEVPGRMRECLGPDLKLIFCLREPVRRAFSHYLHCVRIIEENESFADAMALEAARVQEDRYTGIRRAYIGGSLYAGQIARFLEHFPRENMFFMILEEDFVRNRRETMDRMFAFLGVARDPNVKLEVRDTSLGAARVRFVSESSRLLLKTGKETHRLPPGTILFETGNKGGDRVVERPSALTEAFFRKLAERATRELDESLAQDLYRRHFHDDIGRVEDLIGRDLSAWRR